MACLEAKRLRRGTSAGFETGGRLHKMVHQRLDTNRIAKQPLWTCKQVLAKKPFPNAQHNVTNRVVGEAQDKFATSTVWPLTLKPPYGTE